ncbi:MAG TPA: helix-turn-helix transcriptional regulator [Candidatus Dormibacteraeota bacterium]|nr:helix-turn-helix transcriptional regulator [Candidatus Dormibacteraeota bacterium]
MGTSKGHCIAIARRRELADFLRSRRARLGPEDVGLPNGVRRRTPGLRREEVALIAGVGVTWYTWLEQGREISVSRLVLESICRALRLDAAERAHLNTLAGLDVAPIAAQLDTVPPAVQAMLDELDPCPAYVLNARYDVLAWNRAESALIGDLGALSCTDRNILWLLFTDPAWRSLLVDWEHDAAWVVAQFRAAMARHVGESHWVSLVERLQAASEDFGTMWDRHEVAGTRSRSKTYRHPRVGLLTVNPVSMRLAESPDCRVMVCVPADAASRTALEELAARTVVAV